MTLRNLFRTQSRLVVAMACLLWPLAAMAQDVDSQVRQLIQDENWEAAETRLREHLEANPEHDKAWYYLAYTLHSQERYDEAIKANLMAVKYDVVKSNAWYNLACAYAMNKQKDDAFDALQHAIDEGYNEFNHMQDDSDLEILRADDRWAKLPEGFPFHSLSMDDGGRVEYALVLPEEYDASKTYPMLIAFPPGNQSKSAAETGLNYWWGLPAAQRGWIVAVMVRPRSGWTSKAGENTMKQVLDHFEDEYNIEGGKFHAAGCSGGGPSSFHVVLDFPDRFHSLTGLPADPRGDDFKRLAKLKNVRVSLLVGADDYGWKENLQRAHKRMKTIGVNSTIEIFPNEGHVIQAILGDEFMKRMDAIREEIK
ncbi:MAG: tetratricopeptide repeat protein [Planctomycetota bacterium]|nr:tetratricopeptide repeat protein [Planctomycetota bacterium]